MKMFMGFEACYLELATCYVESNTIGSRLEGIVALSGEMLEVKLGNGLSSFHVEFQVCCP